MRKKRRSQQESHKLVAVAIMFLLLGLCLGAFIGSYQAYRTCAKLGLWILESEGIDIGINEGMLAKLLTRYETQIENTIMNYGKDRINGTIP